MSDLSGQRRWLACSPEPFLERRRGDAKPPSFGRHEVHVDELRFLRLRSAAEIAEIVPLRRTIPLPATAQSDPRFDEIEKKGTRSVWSELLNTTADSLAPCEQCR